MNNKSLIVAVIIVFLVSIGGYFYPKFNGLVGAVSSSGNTFSGPNNVTVTFAPLTSTSTSILNNGGDDRYITGTFANCQSVGTSHTYLTGNSTAGGDLASWTLVAATTSVASQGLQGSTNNAQASMVISTTSGYANISTSTEGVTYAVSKIWPVNTYLTFNFNATNTAACAVGANFISL